MNHIPQITIETITPEAALQLLELNVSNRYVRKVVVARYAADMSSGNWRLTGEPIIVNGTSLVNGQHRLLACVQSGVSFTTAVFRGAGDDVFSVVDSGLTRQHGDVLTHEGHANGNCVAATVRLVLAYQQNTIHDPKKLGELASRQRILAEANDRRSDYGIAASLGRRARVDGFNQSGTAAFCIILGDHIKSLDLAIKWVESVVSGADLSKGDPRLALGKWIVNRVPDNRVHLSAFIRAYNAYETSRSMTQIKPWFTGTPFPRLGNRA